MKPITTRHVNALAVGALFLGGAIAAQAGEKAVQNRSQVVQYADLNLSTPAGIDTFYRRLRAAAETVCAPREERRDLVMRRDWEQCYNNALDAAVTTAAQSALTQHHFARTGRAAKSPATIAKTTGL